MRLNVTALIAILILCRSVAFGQAPQCTRGEPEPVFHSNNPAVQSESFNLISSHEATEEVLFKSGDRLTIRNWGCDAFTLTFRWESKSLTGTDPIAQSLQVLRKLIAMRTDAVFDLTRAASGLEALIKRKVQLKQGEQYSVDGDASDADFQLKFSLRSSGAGSATGSRYVEFDLTLGPL